MNDDPLVAEVRNARDEYARRFHYDLDAICHDLQQKQSQSGRKLVSFPPKRPKPRIQARTHALIQQPNVADPTDGSVPGVATAASGS